MVGIDRRAVQMWQSWGAVVVTRAGQEEYPSRRCAIQQLLVLPSEIHLMRRPGCVQS